MHFNMNADFKVFDVGTQKALKINTFSCNWIGKSIIGKNNKNKNKAKNKNQTKKNKNKKKQKKTNNTSLMIL